MRVSDSEAGARWVTASEIAEYAFCPRAHYYSTQGSPVAPSAGAAAARAEGIAWHEQALRHDVDLERSGYGRAGALLALAFGLLILLAWLTVLS